MPENKDLSRLNEAGVAQNQSVLAGVHRLHHHNIADIYIYDDILN